MKLSEYILLSKKLLKKKTQDSRKSSIILILVIAFCFLTIIVSTSINKTVKSYQSKSTFRTILVSNDKLEDEEFLAKKLRKVKNIQEVYTYRSFRTGVDVIDNLSNNTDHTLYLEAGENGIAPEIIKGRKINGIDDKELICSNKIIFDSDIDTNFNLTLNDYINGEDLLNKKITIQYNSYDYSESIPKAKNTYEEKYTIVGLFDSEIYGNLNTCYTHSKNIININKIIFDGDESLEYSYPSLVTIIDNYENLKSVIKEINSMGYTVSVMEQFNPLIGYLKKLCNITTFILMACCLIIIGAIIKKEKEENITNEQVFFYLGFNEKNIFLINIFKNVIWISHIFLISLIILTIIYLLIIYFVKYKYVVLNVLKIVYPIIKILITYFIVLIFIIIINTIHMLERKKANV